MCDYCSYIETAKECPKCHQMKLFFTTIIEKMSKEKYIGRLGVKCRNPECNFKVRVYQKEDE